MRDDPYRNFNFAVEIDGVEAAGFSEVLMPDAWVHVIEYREGTDLRSAPRKLAGRAAHANVVVRRGLTDDRGLWDWWRAIRDGALDRRDAAIVLLDSERKPVWRWALENAWPVRYAISPLVAEGNDVVLETVELAFERLEAEPLR